MADDARAPARASPVEQVGQEDAGSFTAAPRKADGSIDWLKLYLGFFAMVVGQFMAMLDIQIVASSLPQIQAGIGASNDEISWVQTAYLVPEVVMIPLAGYLSRLWGTRLVFMVSCAGFVVMSVATGLASSVEAMVITRGLQGFIGGAMVPTVFAIAFTAFPPERRNTSSTIMGLIVTLAPTIGPTLGGHITELLNWRWLFFINILPGIAVLILVWRYGNFDRGDPSLAKGFDWPGLISMAAFLMSLTYVLEQGAKDNWFEDDGILWLSVLSAASGAYFIWRDSTYRQPVVQLRALADANFSVGLLINFANGALTFGGSFLLPLFLSRVERYTSAQVGTTMLVSGLTMFFVAPVAGRFVRLFDPRLAIVAGLGIAALGLWSGRAVTPNWDFWNFAFLQAFRSFGVMLAMIGGQMLAMSTIDPMLMKSASGILNLARNTGGAVGLAVLSSQLTSQTALHFSELSSRISIASAQAQAMLAGLTNRMAAMGAADPAGAARKAFDGILQRDAAVLAFGDGFALMAMASLAGMALSLIARPGPPQVWGPQAAPAAKAEAH